jgi:hypothetical protein
MINDVILPDTTKEDWAVIRQRIYNRIYSTLGMPAEAANRGKPQWQELQRYENAGLTHIVVKYHVIDDMWNEGVIVLPAGGAKACPAKPVIAIHGVNDLGKAVMLDPDPASSRPYPLELARQGYIVFALDQFGYGAWLKQGNRDTLYKKFFDRWPGWSLDGLRMFEQMKAVDVMEAMPELVDASKGFAAIGNSLGGRAVAYLGAFDERMKVSIPSCGLSPNCSNTYRIVTYVRPLLPAMAALADEAGHVQWDYHELLALYAPRAVVLLEPFNDYANPDVMVSYKCFDSARKVYQLLGVPEKIIMITHGDGHGTKPHIRQYAYGWIDRALKD